MAELDIALSVGIDRASLALLERSIQSKLENLRLSASSQSVNNLGDQISKNVVPQINVTLSTASLQNIRRQIEGTINSAIKSATAGGGGSVGSRDTTSRLNAQSRAAVDAANAADNVRAAHERASRAVGDFGQRLGFTTNRLIAYLIPAAGLFQLTRGINASITAITDIDREINRLTQILDNNQEAAKQVSSEILKFSTAYGQSGREVLKTATAVAQAGDKFGTTAEDIASVTETLAKTKLVASFNGVALSVQDTAAALGQFSLKGKDLVGILDVSDQLSKKFAVSATDLFEAVRSGGGAFALAGGNAKEFFATVTALKQITGIQASTIGTGINTIALRSLRPEVIRFTEDLVKATGSIRNIDGSLKTLPERWIEIAKATKDYSDEQLAPVIEKLSDIRQGKIFVPLLRDIQKGAGASEFIKALDVASHSAGAFSRDVTIGLDTIDVKLKSISAKFEEVFGKFAEDEGIKRLIGDLATVAKSFADVLDVARPLIPVLLKLGAFKLGALALSVGPRAIGSFANSFLGIPPGSTPPSATGATGPATPAAPGSLIPLATIRASQEKQFQRSTTSLVNAANPFGRTSAGGLVAGPTSTIFGRTGTGINKPIDVNDIVQKGTGVTGFLDRQKGTKSIPFPPVFGKPFDPAREAKLIAAQQQIIAQGQVGLGVSIPKTTNTVDFGNQTNRLNQTALSQSVLGFHQSFAQTPKPEVFALGPSNAGNRRADGEELAKGFKKVFTPSPEEIPLRESNIGNTARLPFGQTINRIPNLFGSAILPLSGTSFEQRRDIEKANAENAARRQRILGEVGLSIPKEGRLSAADARRDAETLLKRQTAIPGFNERVLKTGLDVVGIEKSGVRTNISSLIATIGKVEKELIGQGLSSKEVSVALQKYRDELFKSQVALVRLEEEEAVLTDAMRKEAGTRRLGTGGPGLLARGGNLLSNINNFGRPPEGGLFPTFRRIGQGINDATSGKAGQIGGQVASTAVLLAVPFILDHFATKFENSIKPLIDSNGKLADSLDAALKARVSTATAAGGLHGASSGALFGSLLGSSFGPIGTILGGLGGGIIGGGVGAITAESEAKNKNIETLLGAVNEKNAGKVLDTTFREIFDESGGITARHNAPSSFGIDTGINALANLTLPFGIGGSANDNTRTGFSDIDEEVKRHLATAGGQNTVAFINKKAEDLATTLGKANANPNSALGIQPGRLEGQVRTGITNEIADQIKKDFDEQHKGTGVTLSKLEALGEAASLVRNSFNLMHPDLEGAAKAAEELQKKSLAVADSLNDLSRDISNTITDIQTSIRKTNTETGNINLSQKFGDQAFNTLLGKGTGGFQIPEELVHQIGENFNQALEDIRKASPASQTAQIGGLIGNLNQSGVLSTSEAGVFQDVAFTQNFLKNTLGNVQQGLANKTITGASQKDLGDAIKTALDKELLKGRANLGTEEGKNTFDQLTQTLEDLASKSPEAFREDPQKFVQQFLKEFADGKIIFDKVGAAAGKLQAELNRTTAVHAKFREVEERLVQTQSQIITFQLAQAQRGTSVGATDIQIGQNIDKVIENAFGGRAGILNNRIGTAAENLAVKQQNAAKFQDVFGNPQTNLKGEELAKANKAFAELANAQQAYTNEVNRGQLSLQALRASFENTTKQVNDLLGAFKGLGHKTIDQVNEDKVKFSNFQALTGGITAELKAKGVVNAEEFNTKLSPEEQAQFRSRVGAFAGSQTFVEGLGAAEGTFGGLRNPITGKANRETAGLFAAVAGQSLAGPEFQGSTDALVDLGKKQQEDFITLNKLEEQQVASLNTINQSILSLAKSIIRTSSLPDAQKKAELNTLDTLNQQNKTLAPTTPSTPVTPRATPQPAPRPQAPTNAAPQINAAQNLLNVLQKLPNQNNNFVQQMEQGLTNALKNVQRGPGAKSQIQFDANVNITGAADVGTDVKVAKSVVALMRAFAATLNSTPEQIALAEKLKEAIKQIDPDNKP